MKLLIASDIFPPEIGGPATYVVALANELAKRGHSITIVTLNPNPDRSKVNCPVFAPRSRFKPFRYFSYLWLLVKNAGQADGVYAMGPVNAGLPALVASRLRRRPLVVKVVGDYAWEQGVQRFGITTPVDEFQKQLSSVSSARRLQKIERFVVSRAALVITPSNYLGKMVQLWGAKPERVQVVYNAILVPPGVQPAEKPAGERLVVSVARLVPWKGMGALMRAVKELLGSFPSLKLKILGDGPDRPNLERLRQELGLEKVVELLGNVPRASVLAHMAAADVVALNSGYEGLSHTLLEARFLGRTAIASRMGGNPEVLPDKYLFTWDDVGAIRECLRSTLSSPAEPVTAEFAARFSFETMIAETEKTLQKICAS